MKMIKMTILMLTLLTISSAMARKPAVEDFVGVESQDYSPTTPGTEVLFNFNNSMKQETNSTGGTLFTVLFIASFVSLPFFMWIGLTRSAKTKNTSNATIKITQHTHAHESNNSNVEYLSDYKDKDTNKKAS